MFAAHIDWQVFDLSLLSNTQDAQDPVQADNTTSAKQDEASPSSVRDFRIAAHRHKHGHMHVATGMGPTRRVALVAPQDWDGKRDPAGYGSTNFAPRVTAKLKPLGFAAQAA